MPPSTVVRRGVGVGVNVGAAWHAVSKSKKDTDKHGCTQIVICFIWVNPCLHLHRTQVQVSVSNLLIPQHLTHAQARRTERGHKTRERREREREKQTCENHLRTENVINLKQN